MHIPGILGMPRRIYTYEPGRGWEIWNLIVTIGVFFQTAGVLVFVVQSAVVTLRRASPPGMIPGMRGRSSGPQLRLRLTTILRRFPWSGAGVRFGT